MSEHHEHHEKEHHSEHHAEHHTAHAEGKGSSSFIVLSILLIGIIMVMAFNFMQQAEVNSLLDRQNALLSLSGAGQGNSAGNASGTTALLSEVIPSGVPRVYGSELGISFDDISASNPQKTEATIALLGAFDTQNSGKFITLSGELKQRYIKIASQISCEYCCGAESIIFSNGEAACGCAHSFAMRGVARYLLANHASEFTDDQILEELGKWKTLFFPTILAQKAAVLKQQGIELTYINLASNKYRNIEKGAASGGSMVGGC
ncbi:MAG: hypothetical protein J4478_02000 [Candidatus Diapherotrites archaeon]|uniref:Uncharacterized protein n=1 Tax=Candidatus Iainarchaeum sp. TaxID=3101447 RepID=A0A8T4KUQ6_9ARCH|nr:hypothetical protein [Candidatus Diapherotrites archaeon]